MRVVQEAGSVVPAARAPEVTTAAAVAGKEHGYRAMATPEEAEGAPPAGRAAAAMEPTGAETEAGVWSLSSSSPSPESVQSRSRKRHPRTHETMRRRA